MKVVRGSERPKQHWQSLFMDTWPGCSCLLSMMLFFSTHLNAILRNSFLFRS